MIFISHSEQDADAAEMLADFLAESMEIGADALLLSRHGDDEGAGDEWTRLKADISSCSVVIALVPADSTAGAGVLFELGSAWALDKLIFLLFMPGTDFRDMPSVLTNYQSAEIASPDAHITMMDIAREAADYMGIDMRRKGDTLGALERFLAQARGDDAPEEDDHGFNSPAATIRFGETAGEYCTIVCTYETATFGAPSSGQAVVRATWEDVFKSFARSLSTPQDDEYIKKLLLEFCKKADAKFAQNVQYGMFKKPAIEPYSYQRIIQHFAGLGYVENARAPHSAFGRRRDSSLYWAITERGEDFLSRAMQTRKALQEWNGLERHVQRSAVIRQDKRER